MVSLSRASFNISGIVSSVLLPKMITAGDWNLGAKSALMYVSSHVTTQSSQSSHMLNIVPQAATNALIWIWCIFRLPETKGRTFREIDYLFEESGLHPRKWHNAQVDGFDEDVHHSKIVVGGDVKEAMEHVEYAT